MHSWAVTPTPCNYQEDCAYATYVPSLAARPWRSHTMEFRYKRQCVLWGEDHVGRVSPRSLCPDFNCTLGILPTTKENQAKPLSNLPKSVSNTSFCQPCRLLRAAWTDLLRPGEFAQLSVGRSTFTFAELGGSPHLLTFRVDTLGQLSDVVGGKKKSFTCEFVWYVKHAAVTMRRQLGCTTSGPRDWARMVVMIRRTSYW